MAESEGTSRATAPSRFTIALPPRPSVENLFSGGAGVSPGPMTLASNFFSENDPNSEFRSFSQLLAGAMASPIAVAGRSHSFSRENSTVEDSLKERNSSDGIEKDLRFRQNFPLSLVIAHSPVFMIPPVLSPASFLDSPGFFSPGQGPFRISHQQALAQVTAQAAQSQSQLCMPAEYPISPLADPATSLEHHPSYATHPSPQLTPPITVAPKSSMVESSVVFHSDLRSQPPSIVVNKPADDGYNWRKYGQKPVRGSEYPRSYYKCSHPKCPVKKKVEHSHGGQVTEVIYKGQHNHQPPQSNRRGKGGNSNGSLNFPGNPEIGSQGHGGNLSRSNENKAAPSMSSRDQESNQETLEQLSGSSDGEEAEMRINVGDDNEPNPKRRNTEIKVSEPASSHRTLTEPKIVVQTKSEVDLLDDGYRWRKYGQKVVKGNPYPRSYYKCTSAGCNVRKHVERASVEPKAVITTYEGKHNHGVPGVKTSSHKTASNNVI